MERTSLKQASLKRTPLLAAGAVAAMMLGSLSAAHAQTVIENFTGNFYGGGNGTTVPTADSYNGYTPTDYDGFIPPDTMGSAGSSGTAGSTDFIQMINGGYSVYGSSGTLLNADGTSDTNFWEAAGISTTEASSISDPHILYDPNSGHWFASEITVPSTNANQFLVAVSNDANPLDGFKGYSYNANTGSGTLFADFDMLGINSQGVYVGANMFNTRGSFTSQDILTVSKSGLLSLGTTAPTSTLTYKASYTTDGFGARPVVDQDNGGTASNLSESVLGVGTANNTSDKVDLISGTAGAATLANQATVNFTSATTLAGTAHQEGGTTLSDNTIDTGDNRFSSYVVKQGGIIYSTNTLADKTTGLADIHILAVNATTNAVVIDQIISGTGKGAGGSNLDLYYPSLAINAAGNVVIGYTGSGPSDYASGYVVSGNLAANGKSISFGNAIETAVGAGNYNVTFGSGSNRWGDYSSTTVDPNNPNDFWTVQEFALGTNEWGTQVTEIGTGSSAAPEPSAWATLIFSALGIGGLCLKARKRQAV